MIRHDDYCPSRMGGRCECQLIDAVRADEREKAPAHLSIVERLGRGTVAYNGINALDGEQG